VTVHDCQCLNVGATDGHSFQDVFHPLSVTVFYPIRGEVHEELVARQHTLVEPGRSSVSSILKLSEGFLSPNRYASIELGVILFVYIRICEIAELEFLAAVI